MPNHEAALDALLRYTDGAHAGYCSTHALALTCNVADFERLRPTGIVIMTP